MFPFSILAAANTVEPTLVERLGAWFALAETRLSLAIVFGALGMWLMLPGGPGRVSWLSPFAKSRLEESESGQRESPVRWFLCQLTTLYSVGGLLSLVCVGLLLSLLPAPAREHLPILFWMLAGLTLVSAVATITMHSPVYCAIWFAMTLLGTGGLFFLQGAQFLGVATVVVYAGAILVTFLFVLMLAQPEGHAPYDRLGWGWWPAAFATFAGVTLAALVIFQLTGYHGASATEPGQGVLHTEHVAHLGTQIVTRYLIPLEIAGTLLLVALVGAVAIAIQGKDLASEGSADE